MRFCLAFSMILGATLFGTSLLAAEQPNIILIYTDDQGYGDASCLNPESKFQTPNLDRLAREGISFTDAHCSDTVCTPSRYGLLTGRYSWRTALKRGVFGAEKKCLIDDDRMTIASLLRDHGYQTAMVGKWHLGMDFPGEKGNRDWTKPVLDMPLDKGFDYWFGIPASMNYGVLAWFEGRHATVPPTLYTAKKPNRMAISDYRMMPPFEKTPQETRRKLGSEGLETAPDFIDIECLTRFTDKAIEWMVHAIAKPDSSAEPKPFFLYLPYTSPHKPVVPMPEFRGQGKAGAYGEFMIETDHHVGRILAFLDEQNVADDTMIIFTSDNGPETTWKTRREKFAHRSNYIYREGKRSIYEGGHRVPFFVRWPAGIAQPGRSSGRTVCQTDVLATVAELLEAELPATAGEDSQSFLSVLTNPKDESQRLPTIHHAINGRFAIRDGKWKVCFEHKKQKIELYDLSTDPEEQHDLAANNPQVVERLTQTAAKIVIDGRTTPGPVQPNDTAHWADLTWITVEQYSAAGPKAAAVGPVPESLRKSLQLDPFYQKHVDVHSFPVLGSNKVRDAALLEAAWLVDHMIGHRPEILNALARNKVRLVVMAWNEFTTDLPEQREMEPKDYWDRRARGLGGSRRRPVVSCGEENLLGHPDDPYARENICLHEFAHAIHTLALPDIDPAFDEELKRAYEAALAAGLWKDAYAATDRGEYWAEAAQSWFDDNRENDASHNHVNTRVELIEYDPTVAKLCQRVFGDGSWRYHKPWLRDVADRRHIGELNRESLPRFQWRSPPVNTQTKQSTPGTADQCENVTVRPPTGTVTMPLPARALAQLGWKR